MMRMFRSWAGMILVEPFEAEETITMSGTMRSIHPLRLTPKAGCSAIRTVLLESELSGAIVKTAPPAGAAR